MKQAFFSSKLMITLLFLVSMIFSNAIFAKQINLYDQPEDKAKVIGTIDLSEGIVPIFSSKTGDWMKVGDPRNGNVGWIKSNDINNGGNSSFSFTQRIINNGKGPMTYQVIEYGKPQNPTNEQIRTMIQKMQQQQQGIQQSMQTTIQNMMNEVNKFYQQTGAMSGNMPIIMPIVIMPPDKTTNTPAKKP